MKCVICSKKKEETHTVAKCNHKCCTECLYKYIQDANLKASIKCPEKGCKRIISDPIYREFISYNQEKAMEVASLGNIITKCLTSGCYKYFCTTDQHIIVQCDMCEQPNCFKCKKRHFPNECNEESTNTEADKDKDAKSNIMKNREYIMVNDPNEDKFISPNHAFDCLICLNFTLPKKGYILDCGDIFCIACLKSNFERKQHVHELVCPICEEKLPDIIIKKIVNPKVRENIQKESIPRFSCKNLKCDAEFFVGNKKGTVNCPECKTKNCIACRVVHKNNQTCNQYKESKEYLDELEFKNKFKSIGCYKCEKILVHGGGCNALPCDICNVYTCLFHGNKAGKGGCGCTAEEPCHKDCLFGCFEETKIERKTQQK